MKASLTKLLAMSGLLIAPVTFAEQDVLLETIVVTGEKIDKEIQETPAAVTVFDGENYTSGELNDVNDLVTQAPNVTSAGFGSINIRGVNGAGASVGSNAFMTSGLPRITTTVDGVTDAWAGYNFTPARLWDVQQVEVLRGPQSTTQGTNAIGGAVVVKTNDPGYFFESAVRLGADRYENGNSKYNYALMASGPIVDEKLAARIAVDGSDGEGWMSYEQNETELDDGPDVDDSEYLNLRAKLLWEPTSGLKTILTYSQRKEEGEYLSWANDEDFDDQIQTLSIADRQNTRLQDSTVDTVTADIDYDVNNNLTNSLKISFNDYTAYFEEYPGDTILEITEEKYEFENRLTYVPDDAHWYAMVGLYGSTSDSTLDVDFTTFMMDFYVADGTKTTAAVYSEFGYQMTNKLSLAFGGRIENQENDRTLVRQGSTTLEQKEDETVVLPKLTATYGLNDSTNLGASVSRGYSPGGSALDWWTYEHYTYDKEMVTAYELSAKSVFNSRALVAANLFYNDYEDYQSYGLDRLQNVESAVTYGFELEVFAFATDTLEINASFGTLASKIEKSEAEGGIWDDNELTYSPARNISLGLNQKLGVNWSLGINGTYVSEYYSDLENTEESKAGDYTVVNARANFTTNNIMVDLFVENMGGEDAIYMINRNRAEVGQSRTFGLSGTYKI